MNSLLGNHSISFIWLLKNLMEKYQTILDQINTFPNLFALDLIVKNMLHTFLPFK